MNCPQCGEAIEPDWDECPACETPLSAHCSQCGREVKSNWKKCPACKTRLESGSASSEWSLANEAPSGAGVGGASVQWSMPEPGTALDGKGNLEAWARPRDPRWEVAETLGRGGMGVVFKCRDQRLKRWVAIKRVLCPDAKALSRFRREAEAIAGLPHPNILQIHDFLEDEAGPFIVMEYASGGDLETQVKRNGPLSVDRCVEVLTDVANGLSAAHERRNPDTREREPVLHRDIKPSNMLLMADGTPKLSDFGLARLTGSSTLTLVQGGLGTPTYMAPEQVEAAHLVGPESDIYAIGKTLYFLAVGELPTTIFPEKIPSPLRAVALKCMSTDPSDRFRTVEELLAALSPKPHGTSEHPPGQHEKVQPGPDRGKPKRSAKARPSEAIAHKDAMVRARRTSELPDVREQVGRLRVGKAWPFSVAEAQKRQRETAEALGLPVEYEVTLGAGAAMDFVLIPPGEFLMGSENREKGRTWAEGPVHRVRIEAPFYIGKFPVTQRQWQALMRGNPGKAMADRVPVSGVLWRYCQDFVASLVKSVKLPNGFRWVLPSEAQWEYACRAGASTRYCFGDDPHLQTLGLYAWYEGDSGGGIHAVGEKRPNAWGLHDMHGNVLEWCADVWHRNYRGAPEDGSAWDGAPDRGVRVLRGGSWFFGPNYCRSAFRYCPRRTMVWSDVGLRVSLQIR